MKSYTDSERKEWLVKHGYCPVGDSKWNEITAGISDSEFIDLCLKERCCPAYWRNPATTQECQACFSQGKPMILQAPGDRQRIDQCMAGI